MAATFGILTVSDSCYNGKIDTAGKKLFGVIQERFPNSKIPFTHVIPDDKLEIQSILNKWIDGECNVILTVGGTGFSPRDVTPEATRAVIEREAPGLAYAMITRSLSITPMAMLSRAVCGIKNKSVIINLPGSEKAAVECFSFVQDAIPHCVALLTDNADVIEKEHKIIQKSVNINAQFKSNLSLPSKVKIDNVAARCRISPYPLLEVEDALQIVINESCPTVETEIVSVKQAFHRVLAEDIKAPINIPSVDVSLKDGYAILISKAVINPNNAIEQPVSNIYSVISSVAAGDPSNVQLINNKQAIRICTGAPIPAGANAVVQVENTVLIKTKNNMEEEEIQITQIPKEGQDIRRKGSDIQAGTVVLKRFDGIKAAHLGILASLGITEVKVLKRPSIGIISSGNELQCHTEEFKSDKIFDSNKVTLMNLLKQFSYNCNDCGIARDEPNSLKNTLEKALIGNDIIITTGGVSMGEFDLVKQVLIEDFGAFIHFGRINMKPGKPTTFATFHYNGKFKMVFALPGNPVSASVTCLLFVVPLLKFLERNPLRTFPKIKARMNENIRNADSRPEYVRVKLEFGEKILASSTGNQTSSRLNSLVGANALLLLPGNTIVEKNSEKEFDAYLFDP